jgi:DNA-binding beta-propeller fold protein YncE
MSLNICLLSLFLSLSLGFPLLPRADGETKYQVVANWPEIPAGYSFGAIPGVAVDSKDRVYFFHRGAHPVMIFESSGKFVKSWGDGLIEDAHHIKIDRDGNVWLADYKGQVILKCTPEGKVLMTLGTRKVAGGDATHFDRPTDMAFASNGDIYVSDGYGNNRVVQFSKAGKYIRSWGRKGVDPGEFDLPHAIAVDSSDRVYVADRSNARVQVFDRDGKFLSQWKDLLTPWGLFMTNKDELWACGSSVVPKPAEGMTGIPPKDQLILKISTNGKILERFGNTGGRTPGLTDWVHCIAVSSKGEVFVGDIKGQRPQKFVNAGGR